MTFADRLLKGLREYLAERGYTFGEDEQIIDVDEGADSLCCIVRNKHTDDYRTITLPQTSLADVVSRGRLGIRT